MDKVLILFLFITPDCISISIDRFVPFSQLFMAGTEKIIVSKRGFFNLL